MRSLHVSFIALTLTATLPVVACRTDAPGEPAKQAAPAREREVDRLVEQTLIKPPLKAEAGFTADLIVPPGDLYDPLNIRPQPDGNVWIDDDGAQEGITSGGRLWTVDQQGKVSTLVETRYLLPILGFDVARPDMGPLAGRVFMLTQQRPTLLGSAPAHLIEYVDPAAPGERHRVCALPKNGDVVSNAPYVVAEAREALAGSAGAGVTARFGPAGSPFAKRFFAVTVLNRTVYEATADGMCKPFISFPDGGSPLGVSFSADGTKMLLSVSGWRGRDSALLSVGPDGKADPEPVAVLPGESLRGVAVAPASFGPYGGHVFVTARSIRPPESGPEVRAEPLGKVYRFGPDGKPNLVASGLVSPFDLAFVNDSIWVVDQATDYMLGGFYLPDGFVVRIRRQ